MANGQSGVFTGGAGLVWRRQRVLWWAFIVNLALASYAARTITARVGPVLDNSLASVRLLVQGFHLAQVLSLSGGPEEYLYVGKTPIFFSVIFFFFMLLATGGILEAYWRDETLSTGEFFHSGGTYFWRFLRLVILLVIIFVPVGMLYYGAHVLGDTIDDRAISPYPWLWYAAIVDFVLLLILMAIRLWFDMAEVIAVADSETRSRKCLGRAAGVLRKNFGSLFWLYFRISAVGWIGLAIGLHFWVHRVQHSSIVLSLIFGQLIALFWLGMRFWHRASETLWYKNYLATATDRAPGFHPTEPELAGSAR